MLGTLVNAGAIIVGAIIGVFLRKGITERYKAIVMQGIGLVVALIGIKMAMETSNIVLIIFSMVIGGLIGEAINIDRRLESLGEKLNARFGSGEAEFVQGFVTSSLVYCIGAMAIMGSLESGLTGNHEILYAKSVLDGVSAIVFASTMGIGVAFSGIAVFIYQGSITLLAGFVKVLMTETIIAEMTATGGLLIMAISSNILGIKKFNIANLLPAVFVAVILTMLIVRWFPNYI